MRSSPTSPGLIAIELLIEFVIAMTYLTFALHHLRSNEWVCGLYFLLAGAAGVLAGVAFMHLRQELNHTHPPES